MKVGYNKKFQRKELIFGIIFLSIGIILILNKPGNFIRYGFVLVGFLHMISGIYQSRTPYIQIDNGMLKKAGPSTKIIQLSDIIKIRKFAGDYILYTSEKKLKINSELVDKNQKADLESALGSLGIPFEESPIKYNYKNS